MCFFFFFQAEDGIRDKLVTGVQTCALPIFLSLVSGRNAQYLIEEHVRAVPFLTRHPVATLSTGYILVDGGRVTSVEAVSQTRPLPADKPELAAAHATAARLIGMRAIYLDAGRGAPRPVGADVIRACRAAVPDLTLFVGGGIKRPGQVRAARAAGADFVVVGTALEERGASAADLQALVQAAGEGRPPSRPARGSRPWRRWRRRAGGNTPRRSRRSPLAT